MEDCIISLKDGSEKKDFDQVTDTHYTKVIDSFKKCIVFVTGNRYLLRKYIENIEGKHEHSPILLTPKQRKNLSQMNLKL